MQQYLFSADTALDLIILKAFAQGGKTEHRPPVFIPYRAKYGGGLKKLIAVRRMVDFSTAVGPSSISERGDPGTDLDDNIPSLNHDVMTLDRTATASTVRYYDKSRAGGLSEPGRPPLRRSPAKKQ